MNWWQHFFYSIEANAWIQTLGGFIGALLAGAVAIFLYVGQNKQQRRQERIKELESFLRAQVHLESNFTAVFTYIELAASFETALTDENLRAEAYGKSHPFVTNHLEKLKAINFENVPHEIYKSCITAIGSLENVRDMIELKSDIRASNLLPKMLDKLLVNLKKAYELIEKYTTAVEEELRKLKK